jgi:hypothetical protein
MVIRFETLEKRLLRADATRRRRYVAKVRSAYAAWAAGRVSLERLCNDAGDALQEYASETLDALVGGNATRERPDLPPWVVGAYDQSISRAGAAMRDAVADSTARHAVAQTLQERMLRAESCFRQVIDSTDAAHSRR